MPYVFDLMFGSRFEGVGQPTEGKSDKLLFCTSVFRLSIVESLG